MDAELNCGKMLKTEEERLSSPLDCQSDTESLAQEKAYQHTNHHQKKKANSLPQEHKGNEDANEDEAEDLQLYDSLEVAAHFQDEKNPNAFQTEYLETQMDDGGRISQLLSEDAYSHLRYDPSWKTRLKGAGHSVGEQHQNLKYGKGLVIKGGYRYVGDTSHKLYHVHPQSDQISSITSPFYTNFTLQPRSPEAELTETLRTQNESNQTLRREKDEKSCGSSDENISRTSETTNDSEAVHIQDFQNRYQQELRHTTQGGIVQTQQTVPKVLSKKKPGSVVKNIVESNKITLGRNMCKGGSYARALALMLETSPDGKKVHRSLKETVSSESPKESSPSGQTVQKTQQVGQISKEEKFQQKEHRNPSRLQQPPPFVVKAENGDSLSSPSAKPTCLTHPVPQQKTSSQQPAVHLNIFLNSASDLLPVLQQTSQDAFINLASLHSHTHWGSQPEAALSSAHPTNPGISQISPVKCPLSCEMAGQKCPSETQMKEFVQNLPERPTTTLSQSSSPYPVLPPIRKVTTEEGSELCRGQSVNTTHSIPRDNSESYLLQMEKQKQTRAGVTYKAYTLKDYKQLELDIKLQGLGPDYTAKKKAVSKMKRQKLYSNVIREQNKKISRIPFPLTKDPEGNDKKVLRMKALDYAKTIVKPLASHSQSKQRLKHQPEDFEKTPYLDGLGTSELATLELLRQRHLEERQAVAQFRKVHAV
ncbi:jhy protein homolog [Melanotaenia boesemani]|uniref:jhy protein homolog n=1 Tax=Melanotaenia boesemani TaxID=1250792 RepID=UPI001C041879|nr:jhy protein homolog [Melanotaenia boesemani]